MLHISGRTRVFMVAGEPVAQVQAPAIFNGIFSRHGIDAVLVPAHVPAGQFVDFACGVLAARNIDGLWLTIPHKTALMARLARVNEGGALAGSVNAVRRLDDGRLEGAQFDGIGLVKALRHLGCDPQGRRVLLVGTGGAGAAIAVALADAGVAELGLHDLRAERATELARRLQRPQVRACALQPEGFDLIVHATPLGLHLDDPLPIDVSRLSPDAVVFDILMKHRPTPLLQACAARGITAHPGFEMLVQQVPDYLSFFGMEALAQTLAADLGEVRLSLLALPG